MLNTSCNNFAAFFIVNCLITHFIRANDEALMLKESNPIASNKITAAGSPGHFPANTHMLTFLVPAFHHLNECAQHGGMQRIK